MIPEGSKLWNYFSPDQRVMASDGAYLLADIEQHHDSTPTDYSYLVFPFAKLYEGFLKQLFLDLGVISEKEYNSEHYRIGKSLSPNLVGRLRARSAYRQIQDRYGKESGHKVVAYLEKRKKYGISLFPGYLRALTHEAAQAIVHQMVDTMNDAIDITNVSPRNREND